MPRQTLVTKYFSSPNKEKESPRDSAPLHSTKQETNHRTRETKDNFSQEGRKFQPRILSKMGEL
jgi:hypothetical protein